MWSLAGAQGQADEKYTGYTDLLVKGKMNFGLGGQKRFPLFFFSSGWEGAGLLLRDRTDG